MKKISLLLIFTAFYTSSPVNAGACFERCMNICAKQCIASDYRIYAACLNGCGHGCTIGCDMGGGGSGDTDRPTESKDPMWH